MSAIDIKIGDVILSSGSNELQVRIQHFLHSQWTGVSIVIPWANGDRLVILESTQIPICEYIVYRRNSQTPTNTFFCAELVAATYQKLGILRSPPTGRSANNYIPGDFSEEQESLDLDRGYLFAPQHSLANRFE